VIGRLVLNSYTRRITPKGRTAVRPFPYLYHEPEKHDSSRGSDYECQWAWRRPVAI